MLPIRFSEDAESDIDQIAAYTLSSWGQRQLGKYADKLDDAFEHIQSNPLIGRSCSYIRSGLRRLEAGSHVVFYAIEPDNVLIVRALHQQMLPTNYF